MLVCITTANAPILTAWAAIIAIVVTVACSIGNAIAQRHHNRLKARAHLTHCAGKNKLLDGVTCDGIVRSDGGGSAIIKTITLFLDDKPYVPANSELDLIESLVAQLIPVGYKYRINKYGFMGIDSYMIPETEHVIISITVFFGPEINRYDTSKQYLEHFTTITRALDRIDLVVDYESIYGNSAKLDTRVTKSTPIAEGKIV